MLKIEYHLFLGSLVIHCYLQNTTHDTNLKMSLSTLKPAQTLAQYVGFVPVSDRFREDLKTLFLDQLEGTKDIVSLGDRVAEPIIEAIEQHKFKIKMYIPICKTYLLDHHDLSESFEKTLSKIPLLIIISCHQDFKLELMGKKHKFPRGFPLIWYIGSEINFSGFKPKFKNDDRATKLSITGLGFAYSKKLSGYLGQAMAFLMDDQICWTACSKNSADSLSAGIFGLNYVADAGRIYAPYMTEQVVKFMYKNNVHILSEVLSEYDKNHGADVLCESPVTTALGKGVVVDLIKKTVKDLPTDIGYVTFLPFQNMIDTCMSLGLPVCEAVIATGEAGNILFKELQDARDMLDDIKYEEMLGKIAEKFPKNITIIKGNTTHRQVLGITLEGFVVQVISDNDAEPAISNEQIIEMLNRGKGDTFKFKLATYVSRTMGFRQMIAKGHTVNTCEPSIKSFTDHWCLSEDGANYWSKFLWQCMINHENEPALEKSSEPNKDLAVHIRIADKISEIGFDADLDDKIAKIRSETLYLSGPYTVVLPYWKETDISAIKERLDVEQNWITTTNLKTKPKKAIGWINITKNPQLPSKTLGAVFQFPLCDNPQSWQEKNLVEFQSKPEYSEINEVGNYDELITMMKRLIKASISEQNGDGALSEDLANTDRELKASVNNSIAEISEAIDKCIADGKLGVFVLTGPQALGKTYIVNGLIEKYGADLIFNCSADKHMGDTFNALMLQRVHNLCQMDCYTALKNGKFAIIDNTSMEAYQRTIYHKIATVMEAEIQTKVIAGSLWLDCATDVREKTINLLDHRSKERAKMRGKTIERYVIENAITKATNDKERYGKLLKSGHHAVQNWEDYYPKTPIHNGKSIDSNTLKYRSMELTEKCSLLFDAYSKSEEAPENVKLMRLQYEIMRGIDDFYATIINPNELRKLMKEFKKKGEKFPKAKDIVIEGEPEVKGIGQACNEEGKHAVFAVLDWEGAQAYRVSHGLERKDFHVTLAFEKDDIHNIPKNLVQFAI